MSEDGEQGRLDRYSLNIAGADRLLVLATDYEKSDDLEGFGQNGDPATISKITNLLKVFPKVRFDDEKNEPHRVLQVLAFKEGREFAFFQFRGHVVRLYLPRFNGYFNSATMSPKEYPNHETQKPV